MPSWVLGPTCLPLLSWTSGPHREESPLMSSQLKAAFGLGSTSWQVIFLEGPSVRSQDSEDRSFPPGITDELCCQISTAWWEDTGLRTLASWGLCCAHPLQVPLAFMAGAPGLPPWVLWGLVNGKVLLLPVMLNPHKVMAKPHQYCRRGASHLLFRHFLSSKGVNVQGLI